MNKKELEEILEDAKRIVANSDEHNFDELKSAIENTIIMMEIKPAYSGLISLEEKPIHYSERFLA